MTKIIEDHIERWVIESLQQQDYGYLSPEKMDPDQKGSLRSEYREVLIESYLSEALKRINPHLQHQTLQQAIKDIQRVPSQGDLIACNQYFHTLLTDGIDVTYIDKGEERTVKAWLVDNNNTDNNQWVVTHQVSIIENGKNKRPDIIIYLNGIPVIVIELKNAGDETATIEKAFQQLQTYHKSIPSLFCYNILEIISDGLEAKVGTITSGFSRFMSWKTSDGHSEASRTVNEMSVMIDGMMNKEVLMELFLNFIVFEKNTTEDTLTHITKVSTVKKVAAYHQYYAVKKAVESTINASSIGGSRKGGVVWHTQGSGKSLSMVFFTGMLIKALNNPTVIVITDRNDLDDQLFETFASCSQLLRQIPVQINDREHLIRELHNRQSGGVFFTTIQKFMPEDGINLYPLLSDRSNLIVIADEAHRTQYGFDAKVRYLKDDKGSNIGSDVTYGFAKHMRDGLPNATFIGFTGTPVESTDKNTKSVFGEYVDVYDIERAVLDGSTVPIYYEDRFAKLKLDLLLTDHLEEELVKVSENIPAYIVEGAVSRATRMDSIVGHSERLKIIANDIVTHFEDRAETFSGKALIVSMNRNIAVALYNKIIELRPVWHDDRDDKGAIKVIMTGSSSDEQVLQPHIRSKKARTLIANRLKEPTDPLQMVIVIDMWLTGFDAPVLHTMYLDKDMSGHNLMQAIARVNRVFNDKPGGLIVDYVPVSGNLREALRTYTENKGHGRITLDISEAVNLMMTKLEIVQDMMHGYNYYDYFVSDVSRKMNIILESEEHILSLENGKERFLKEVTLLSRTYALCKAEPEAKRITEEVALFQAIKARLSKFDLQVTGQQRKDFSDTVKSLVDSAISSDGVVNLLDMAGLQKPEISIFSKEFMDEIRNMKQKNVSIELLKKLLSDQIKIRFARNMVITRSFTQKLQNAINKYNLKAITALEMIEMLMEITKDVTEETQKGEDLGLSPAEKAFYDALSVNRSAQELMGDKQLMIIAKELVVRVKKSTTIDWTIRQSARDKVMLEVKRVLRSYKYPPDDEKRATDTLLEQAEMYASDLAA